MNSAWGNSSGGPGGEQSWLGGSDRDDSGASGNGWSSDFGESGPVPEAPDQQGPDHDGPDFGGRAGEDGSSRPKGDDSGWASAFTGANGNSSSSSSSSGKGMAPALIGVLTSVVGIVIFAVIAYKMGLDLWWVVLFVGIPLIRRVGRVLRRSTRR